MKLMICSHIAIVCMIAMLMTFIMSTAAMAEVSAEDAKKLAGAMAESAVVPPSIASAISIHTYDDPRGGKTQEIEVKPSKSGALKGAAAGAAVGAAIAGPVGAAVGGVVGGIAGWIFGPAD